MPKEIFFLWVLVSCHAGNSREESPEHFVERVRRLDLRLLRNVAIKARNERNHRYHYYYSHTFVQGDTLTVPSFEYFDDLVQEDSTYLPDLYTLAGVGPSHKALALRSAKAYAKQVEDLYQQLHVINLVAVRDSSASLKFTLSRNCDVFYVKNPSALTAAGKAYFGNIKQVDAHWFYECR